LDRILGNTSTSSNVLATAPNLDLIAYAAGAVVVLYNQKRNKQVGFLYLPSSSSPSSSINNSSLPTSTLPLVLPLGSGNELLASNPTNTEDEKKNTPASTRAKPISCLTFSPDGKYLAAGEVRFKQVKKKN
jgi:hypothetical protein